VFDTGVVQSFDELEESSGGGPSNPFEDADDRFDDLGF
jgi:hypothetical protein